MRFFSTSDGVKLAYRDEGKGPPLLCLSGLTRNSSDFDFVAPHLAGHRLIRLDYRGRGASQWADPATYTIAREAADVLELLDFIGLDAVTVLGTSRGGLIAMTLAASAHDRLKGVILNDIGPEIDPAGLALIDSYLGRPPPYKTYDAAAVARQKMPGFYGVPQTRWQQEVRNLFTETADGLGLNYDPALRMVFTGQSNQPLPDLWPLFAALEGVPLALIRGENSNILSPETAGTMRRQRPDMIFTQVPDRGHVPFLDESESLHAINVLLETIQ